VNIGSIHIPTVLAAVLVVLGAWAAFKLVKKAL
jgi:hypothetical protein